ncbi:ABC transporter ATP-binding protein [Microbispora sp. RL4-1S]|uniref:ABC transporter ATP-binding protein n=1 Tax=Microbispora oryzae TaxID=2806554 RepID=A0A941AMV1_9ACTN|nr:ABC transporter ATP-binding protein [Microbispora oryzae]
MADDRCRAESPPAAPYGPGRTVRCFRPGQDPPRAPETPPVTVPVTLPVPAESPAAERAVVSVRGVTKRFRSAGGSRRTAVDEVSFELRAGEALGLVGESGSGKSTTARMVLAEFAPDAGDVLLDGEAWSGLRERDRRPRRARIQLVDQDPLSSFDPRFTVQRIIGEALPRGFTGDRGRRRVAGLLGDVGLGPEILDRLPAQLSGGQRQRVAIARALAPGPEVLVCDEPVSALDVTVQAQILALLARLRRGSGLSLLFISHDVGVVRQVCDRVAVMKDGALVEIGDVETVLRAPRAPYTRALLSAVPRLAVGRRTAVPIPVPDMDLKGPT